MIINLKNFKPEIKIAESQQQLHEEGHIEGIQNVWTDTLCKGTHIQVC